MKRVVLVTALLLMSAAPAHAQRRPVAKPHTAAAQLSKPVPAPAPAPALPTFEFKQARAGEAIDPTALGKCVASSDGIPGKIECRGSDPVVAGITLLVAPSYFFYNNRLTSMLYLYDNNGVNYLTFLSAFRDKYGPPCSSGTEKWQSKGGTTLDNATATWCFRTGKLRLDQIGPSLKYGLVIYTDDVSGPSKETPKDF